jgi:hypothetical protein
MSHKKTNLGRVAFGSVDCAVAANAGLSQAWVPRGGGEEAAKWMFHFISSSNMTD